MCKEKLRLFSRGETRRTQEKTFEEKDARNLRIENVAISAPMSCICSKTASSKVALCPKCSARHYSPTGYSVERVTSG